MRHPWYSTRNASKLTFVCFQLQFLNWIIGAESKQMLVLILWYWFSKLFFSEHFQPDLSQPSKEALLVYHDDSSDELNDKLDEMLLPASDTDNDDWDNQNEAAEAESSDEAEDVVEVEDDSDDNAGADQDESDQDGGPRVNGVNPDEGHESSDMDADD